MQQKAGLWQQFQSLFAYTGPPIPERFVLDEPERERELADAPGSIVTPGASKRKRHKIKPYKVSELKDKGEPAQPESSSDKVDDLLDRTVDSDLEKNLDCIRRLFFLPANKDLVIREFTLAGEPRVKAAAVFIEGISEKNIINKYILEPLVSRFSIAGEGAVRSIAWLTEYLPSNQVTELKSYKEVVKEVIAVSTVIFLDGADRALAAETKGFEHRTVSDPKVEQVTQGPHLAFNEVLKVNTSLVRSFLRSNKLVTEYLNLPNSAHSDIAIMYMTDIANPDMLREVRQRIESIRSDYMFDAGRLEQYIEDNPNSPVPQTLRTERPDRVAGALLEGRVAIFTTGSSYALIAPVTFWSLLQAAEDIYTRWPAAAYLRVLRLIAVFFAMLLPAIYVAVATFHTEMVPTDLVLAIAAAREKVPFPTVVEVLLMEMSFELIREAGVRVPGVIGPTIGIVGALILGQAAVTANIVSPLLIIVVAVTGLSSYAIPNVSLSNGLRSIRFFYILFAVAFGFFGIAFGLFVLLVMTAGLKSFGVPMLAPLGPVAFPSPDLILRGHVWQQDRLPDELQTRTVRRQPQVSRGWMKPYLKQQPGSEGKKPDREGGDGDGQGPGGI